MDYWKVIWHHDFDTEPVVLYNEIGEDGYEVRKVDEYCDGRLAWADETREVDGTRLGEIPVGPIEDVQAQAEFSAFVITKEQFEVMWDRATS
jgi:hypothetical protein